MFNFRVGKSGKSPALLESPVGAKNISKTIIITRNLVWSL